MSHGAAATQEERQRVSLKRSSLIIEFSRCFKSLIMTPFHIPHFDKQGVVRFCSSYLHQSVSLCRRRCRGCFCERRQVAARSRLSSLKHASNLTSPEKKEDILNSGYYISNWPLAHAIARTAPLTCSAHSLAHFVAR